MTQTGVWLKVLREKHLTRVRVLADDGVRVWVDGQLLIDKWQDQHPRQFVAERTMTGGMHDVKVEYYENTGGARVQVRWEKVASSREAG